MQRIVHEYLTLQQELLVSVYYLNVEKFKYLISQNEFKPEYLYTRTNNVEDKFHIYCINQAYRYICQLDEYKEFKAKNDLMLKKWNEHFDLPIENDQCLINHYFHRHGPDYAGDVSQFKDFENHLELTHDLEFWRHCAKHLGKEECVVWSPYDLDYIVKLAMIIRMKNMVEKEKYHEGVDFKEVIAEREKAKHEEFCKSIFIPDEVKSFIDKHDNPGEILALYDEDKCIYRCMPHGLHSGLCDYLCKTKYLRIRVGGNSFRIGDILKDIAKQQGTESKIEDIQDFVYDNRFEWEESLIQYADKYDFRYQGDKSMVWFYTNNVTCGWYKEDGTFQGFNDNNKGS